MRIVVIYDNRRNEKYDFFVNELLRQGIDEFEIMPAIVLPNIVESISESFKSIIRKAKENGDNEICIMEDDVSFPHKDGWRYFISNKPESFDIYTGCNYLINDEDGYDKPLVKVREYVGNQCIIVNERYYDTWLATDSKKHCDTVHAGLGDFYVCFPFIALQRTGWSANNKAVVNYSKAIPQEYILK